MPLFALAAWNFIKPFIWYIVAAVTIIAAVWGGVAYLKHRGVVQERAANEAAENKRKADEATAQISNLQAQVARSNAIAGKLETNLAASQAAEQKLHGRLQHEIAARPVYHTCRVPADGLRIYADAVSATAVSASAP